MIAEDLKAKFDALYPTWPTVLATVLAMLILLIILTKLVYQPVRKMYNDRRNYIQNNIDEAERLAREAKIDRERAAQALAAAHMEATEIVVGARLEAQQALTKKLAEAQGDAARIVADATRDAQAQRIKFEQEAKHGLVDLALTAASKVLEHETSSAASRKIVEDFIKNKAGND